LTTRVKPLKTLVKPLKTLVKPLKTLVKPLKTLVKPLKTPIEPLPTLVKLFAYVGNLAIRRAQFQAYQGLVTRVISIHEKSGHTCAK